MRHLFGLEHVGGLGGSDGVSPDSVFALCVHSVREELIRTVSFCVIKIASVFDTLSHVLELVV